MSDLESVTRENRRLHREVANLRDRVHSFEKSRWWRLHPRFAVQKMLGSARARPEGAVLAGKARLRTSYGHVHEVDRFDAEVVSRGAFTARWFLQNIPTWDVLLRDLEGAAAKVLEVGSFEGMSSCYVLWRLPDARLTCVDTFKGSPEHLEYEVPTTDLGAIFERNVALVDAARVRKLVGLSRRVLPELLDEGARFDLVYVDGSHLGLDVLGDAALAWQLLGDRGLLIFDDYEWAMLGDDPLLRPGAAIDAFLGLVKTHSRVLQRKGQVILRKT